jgi:hypothetical protein
MVTAKRLEGILPAFLDFKLHFYRGRRSMYDSFLKATALALLAGMAAAPVFPQTQPRLRAGFREMYELKFDAARIEFAAYERDRSQDPLGPAAVAASYLFEEFNRKGVFTSAFFLNDAKLLGGVDGPPDKTLGVAFREANERARTIARERLKLNPRDPDGLFGATLADGMEADYEALIEKRQLSSLHFIREAEKEATTLLAVKPDSQDAYVALGAANYIVGCLPGYKRMFLRLGGIHGDRKRGMDQLEIAANQGNYLRPFAKVMLALTSLREKQPERARTLFAELASEFPQNPAFARESVLADQSAGER